MSPGHIQGPALGFSLHTLKFPFPELHEGDQRTGLKVPKPKSGHVAFSKVTSGQGAKLMGRQAFIKRMKGLPLF